MDRFPVSTGLHERILSEVLGESVESTRLRLRSLLSRAEHAAAELMSDTDYRESLQELPFCAGDRIAALGDSMTADRLGWFELVCDTLGSANDTGIATHNLGLSGDTTADALERFDLLEAFRPTHVLVMLGTNDARRHGRATDHRMVTLPETRRNLEVLLDLITRTLGAQAIFITPPPADQARITTFFADAPLRWDAAELDDAAELVRTLTSDHIDIHACSKNHSAARLSRAGRGAPEPRRPATRGCDGRPLAGRSVARRPTGRTGACRRSRERLRP